jgi:hypothetical protein
MMEHEIMMILVEAHDRIEGGIFVGKATAKNILCPRI